MAADARGEAFQTAVVSAIHCVSEPADDTPQARTGRRTRRNNAVTAPKAHLEPQQAADEPAWFAAAIQRELKPVNRRLFNAMAREDHDPIQLLPNAAGNDPAAPTPTPATRKDLRLLSSADIDTLLAFYGPAAVANPFAGPNVTLEQREAKLKNLARYLGVFI